MLRGLRRVARRLTWRGQLPRQVLLVALLTVAAGWASLHSPTIFFDHQILVGGSLGVFALLQFGWLGLPVGLAAALSTITLWGHPWAALILLLLLLWQLLFLTRLNGSWRERGNGRIVLATILFCLVVGLPLKVLLYATFLQVDPGSALALGLKETAVAVANASLGLLLYLALLLNRRRAELPLRGLVFTTLLLLISLPGGLIVTVMGQQITDQSLGGFHANLEQQARAIAGALPPTSPATLPADSPLRQRFGHLAFAATASSGGQVSSDPGLFQRVATTYSADASRQLQHEQLELLLPQSAAAMVQRALQGYWRCELNLPSSGSTGWQQIVVLAPAREQILQLIALMRPSLLLLGLLMIAAALISEAMTMVLSDQFQRVLTPFLPGAGQRSAPVPGALAMPQLRRSRIRELNRVVSLINAQGRRFNALSQQLMESEQRHRLLADHAEDVITLSDPSGRPTYISPSIEKVRGWTVAEAMALPMDQQLTPEGCAVVIDALRQTREALAQGLPLPSFRLELQQSHKNGSWIWTEASSSCIVDPSGTYIGTLLVYRDIQERKRLEAELLQRASIDELTGLLNRRELLLQVEALLQHTNRRHSDEHLAVLFCDLDCFKEINDTLGHAAGDLVLRTVAERIRQAIRSDDLAGRMGGDEMVVVLRAISDLDAAVAIAETIAAAIAGPISSDHHQIVITASIGVTLARPEEAVDALLARADIAMYEGKQAGRAQVVRIA